MTMLKEFTFTNVFQLDSGIIGCRLANHYCQQLNSHFFEGLNMIDRDDFQALRQVVIERLTWHREILEKSYTHAFNILTECAMKEGKTDVRILTNDLHEIIRKVQSLIDKMHLISLDPNHVEMDYQTIKEDPKYHFLISMLSHVNPYIKLYNLAKKEAELFGVSDEMMALLNKEKGI